MISRKRNRTALVVLIPVIIVITGFSLYLIHGPFYLYLNITNSMPKGIYVKANLPIVAGTLVIFPSSAIRSYDENVPKYLLKKVLPYHGELVTINKAGLFLDSTLVARREVNEGTAYRSVLPQGYVLLIGESERSFDSRYFGPVKVSDLTAVRPLISW